MAYTGTIDGPFLTRQWLGLPNISDIQQGADLQVDLNKRNVISTGAATLTAAQSGSLCLFNTAAGYTFTLPAPSAALIGLWFEFLHTVTNTSVVAKVITDAASTFLVGEVFLGVDNTTPAAGPGPKGYAFNGTTHRACNQGGTDTTTGGVIGSRFKVELVTATQWGITGFLIGAGTIATPVSTT